MLLYSAVYFWVAHAKPPPPTVPRLFNSLSREEIGLYIRFPDGPVSDIHYHNVVHNEFLALCPPLIRKNKITLR